MTSSTTAVQGGVADHDDVAGGPVPGTSRRRVRGRAPGRPQRRRRGGLAGFLFTLPALVFVFAFMIYPLLSSGWMSLTEYNFVYDDRPRFIGLDNYVAALQEDRFITSLTNTFTFGAFYFVLVMASGLTIALLLFPKLALSGFHRSAVFVPLVVPLSLAALIFLWILQPNYGLLNHVLGQVLGADGLTRAWLSDGTTAMAAIIVLALWASIGFVTILFLAGLQSISADVLEAAEMDGARGLKKIFYIILPNLGETYVLTGTWAIIHGLKVFVEPMVMTDGGPGTSTLAIYQHVYITAFTYFDMGYASAMGYILGLIILTLVVANFYIGKRKREDAA